MDKYELLLKMKKKFIERGVLTLTDYDYQVCQFIYDNLYNSVYTYYEEHELNVNNLCVDTINSFFIFNDDRINSKIFNIMSNTKIVKKRNRDKSKSCLDFSCIVDSSTINDDNELVLSKIVIPEYFSDIASTYLGHEINHALKDVSLNEYKYILTYADVIPIFFELIDSDHYNNNISKSIIDNRIALINGTKSYLDIHFSRCEVNSYTDVLDSKRCQYLNSFYYSLLLYRLYKYNPKYVLDNVKKVLLKEMSTYELIDELGLRCRCFDGDVSDELVKLKNR